MNRSHVLASLTIGGAAAAKYVDASSSSLHLQEVSRRFDSARKVVAALRG